MAVSPNAEQPTRALSREERLSWLRLARSENIGPITFRQLLARFGSAEAALDAVPDLARRGGRARPIRLCPPATARQEMEQVETIGAQLLAYCEPDYPAALAAIDDAPPLLSLLGHADLLKRPTVAVVGARNASANGRRLARKLAAELGEAKFVVASGMARGIDAAAHEGALDSGTVAVLAGGVDVVYPEENRALYGEIEARGALVSEIPPGTVPQTRHFPRRNRLISGLSLGALVVEATLRSGSLITARLALEQGREVFAVPGSPLDPRAHGCNRLLRQGAVLVERGEDVAEALQGMLRQPLEEPAADRFPGAGAAGLHPPTDDTVMAEARRSVEALLGAHSVTVDQVVRASGLNPTAVLEALLELELAGRIERHPGQKVALAGDRPDFAAL
jgi:DNA processing protein